MLLSLINQISLHYLGVVQCELTSLVLYIVCSSLHCSFEMWHWVLHALLLNLSKKMFIKHQQAKKEIDFSEKLILIPDWYPSSVGPNTCCIGTSTSLVFWSIVYTFWSSGMQFILACIDLYVCVRSGIGSWIPLVLINFWLCAHGRLYILDV